MGLKTEDSDGLRQCSTMSSPIWLQGNTELKSINTPFLFYNSNQPNKTEQEGVVCKYLLECVGLLSWNNRTEQNRTEEGAKEVPLVESYLWPPLFCYPYVTILYKCFPHIFFPLLFLFSTHEKELEMIDH